MSIIIYRPFESLIRITFDIFQRFLKMLEFSEIYTDKEGMVEYVISRYGPINFFKKSIN